jgi:ubiquinone biosynthesis protein
MQEKTAHIEYESKSTDEQENNTEQRDSTGEITRSKKTQAHIEFHPFAPYKGVLRRLLSVYKQVAGLLAGGLIAHIKELPPEKKKGIRTPGKRLLAFIIKPFVKKELRNLPFEVQLRKRLELLGSTYVKLGQIMSIREDILPKLITDELKNLLDRLPDVPFDAIKNIIEEELGGPIDKFFRYIDEKPLASASIAQVHFAETYESDRVVLKVIKPGIRSSVLTDIKLLKALSHFLEWVIPRYQPKMIINEFCNYTAKEVDLTYEADHSELFAANFRDNPYVAFPKIYRELSTRDVLCMEYFEGYKPKEISSLDISDEDRQKLIDYGAGAIIKMLYEDGFFHADLHPGNLIILSGPKVGFIDLGMVGRFDDKTRRHLLYYFHALVNNDVEGSTKYLLNIARIGEGGDPKGFRRAVNDLFRRYTIYAAMGEFSLGQLILESLRIGGEFKVFFPVEMTLMVKALVTFEGVGLMFDPKLDVPAVSRKHITRIYYRQYNPQKLGKEFLRGTPEIVDVLIHFPQLVSDVARYLEESLNEKAPQNPMAGLRSGLIAGACIVGGVLAYIQHASPLLWIGLLATGLILALFGK